MQLRLPPECSQASSPSGDGACPPKDGATPATLCANSKTMHRFDRQLPPNRIHNKRSEGGHTLGSSTFEHPGKRHYLEQRQCRIPGTRKTQAETVFETIEIPAAQKFPVV